MCGSNEVSLLRIILSSEDAINSELLGSRLLATLLKAFLPTNQNLHLNLLDDMSVSITFSCDFNPFHLPESINVIGSSNYFCVPKCIR